MYIAFSPKHNSAQHTTICLAMKKTKKQLHLARGAAMWVQKIVLVIDFPNDGNIPAEAVLDLTNLQ